MSEMSLERAVMSRHSVRGFQRREVSQDLLNKIFDIARSIGTGHQNSAKTRELALFMLLDKHS